MKARTIKFIGIMLAGTAIGVASKLYANVNPDDAWFIGWSAGSIVSFLCGCMLYVPIRHDADPVER